jgi:hypothetical protein
MLNRRLMNVVIFCVGKPTTSHFRQLGAMARADTKSINLLANGSMTISDNLAYGRY